MLINDSTINDDVIKTKTPKENPLKYDEGRKLTQISNLWIQVSNFNNLMIKTSTLKNENNKLKGLVQPINQQLRMCIR